MRIHHHLHRQSFSQSFGASTDHHPHLPPLPYPFPAPFPFPPIDIIIAVGRLHAAVVVVLVVAR